MIQRCTNSNEQHWKWYGARGIKVCARWLESYEAFLADVGRRPSPKHCLDRINKDGNYEPGNVRWATKSEQADKGRSSAIARAETDKTHTEQRLTAVERQLTD